MARKRKPVSGPGRMSERTDLSQPIRQFPAQFQGQRQQLHDLQSAAPLTAGSSPPSPSPGAAPGGGAAAMPSVFDPTLRPGEPITEGAPVGPGSDGGLSMEGVDTDTLLQVMASIVPSPVIYRLMTRPPGG